MLCEICKKNHAAIHLTEVEKNERVEMHLCEICAREKGLNSNLTKFSISIPEMLSFLDVDEIDECDEKNICKRCGMTFEEYRRIGKLGCQDCYVDLLEPLEQEIVGYHKDKKHIGKIPEIRAIYSNHDDDKIAKNMKYNINVKSLNSLKMELKLAISEERYEDAAGIRDKITELSGHE